MTSSRAARLAEDLGEALADRTLAVAESCTGGALAAALVAGGETERWFAGGIVAYQDRIKRSVLGVTASATVSQAAAREMALGARRLFEADTAIATTGVFGDEAVDGVDPTTVVIATLVGDDPCVQQYELPSDPEAASDRATELALNQLLRHLVVP